MSVNACAAGSVRVEFGACASDTCDRVLWLADAVAIARGRAVADRELTRPTLPLPPRTEGYDNPHPLCLSYPHGIAHGAEHPHEVVDLRGDRLGGERGR